MRPSTLKLLERARKRDGAGGARAANPVGGWATRCWRDRPLPYKKEAAGYGVSRSHAGMMTMLTMMSGMCPLQSPLAPFLPSKEHTSRAHLASHDDIRTPRR